MASPSTMLRQRYIYLVLCVVGVFLPYWQFVPWFLDHGLDIPLFVSNCLQTASELFSTLMSLFRHWCSGSSFLQGGGRLGMRRLWVPVIGTLLVGVSLGLPLFLYMRQLHLDKTAI